MKAQFELDELLFVCLYVTVCCTEGGRLGKRQARKLDFQFKINMKEAVR